MRLEIRVRAGYDETDFAGVIRRTSHLHFMELDRTEWFREGRDGNGGTADSSEFGPQLGTKNFNVFAPPGRTILRATAHFWKIRAAFRGSSGQSQAPIRRPALAKSTLSQCGARTRYA
jgi:hypothetical protein